MNMITPRTLHATFTSRRLEFRQPVHTSRGEMLNHNVFFVQLSDGKRKGFGEAAPLPGLSPENAETFETNLQSSCNAINDGRLEAVLEEENSPAIRFAVETAIKSLGSDPWHSLSGDKFETGYGIPINGLVWMSDSSTMLKQALYKAEQGFDCIKFKVGALDFDEECRMLESFRKQFNAFKTEIRLDANGAFSPGEALEKMKEFSRFEIHSIEQPVAVRQWELMAELCHEQPISVALDEELIGLNAVKEGQQMLQLIRPGWLILKPTLLGGTEAGNRWIELANSLGIGWWATSALESNLGLNAIAHWIAEKNVRICQGLGTGELYRNNLRSSLIVEKGMLKFDSESTWEDPDTPGD